MDAAEEAILQGEADGFGLYEADDQGTNDVKHKYNNNPDGTNNT